VGRPNRILLISVAVIATAAAGAWYMTSGPASVRTTGSAGPAAVPVSVATVVKQDVPIYLTGLGTVQAMYTVGIRGQVEGALQEVLFTEGQYVHKGDVLAKIDPSLYQAALDLAKAKKAQDEANLIAARKDLERARTLVAKSFETVQNMDQQIAKVDALTASIKADDAAIESAQANVGYTSIRAPSDGRVGLRLVDPGNLVHTPGVPDTMPITTLTLTKPATVLFTLSSRSLSDVRQALAEGPVEVTALSQDSVHTLGTGKLLLIDNIVDQASATIRLKAIFDNKEETLWPGDFVNARVRIEVRRDALVIPSPAIQRGPDGIYTWVVKDGDAVEARKIAVGRSTGDRTMVTSGLAEGERVVVDGQYKLRLGSRVTVNQPAAPAIAERRSGS
jgi:membrane fusion protein, multidrug efflux system